MSDRQLRWLALSVLVFSSTLNYLDRLILSALMPTLRREFGIGGAELGGIVAAFYVTYALASPFMGLLIDRIGLRWGASLIVAGWSLASLATGLVTGLSSLMICRGVLGLAESGGIPATGKGYAVYLEPRDRALGAAVGQIGLTVGTIAAPLITEILVRWYGWRSAFMFGGVLGFVWIPVWLWTSARIPGTPVQPGTSRMSTSEIFRDRRFVALIVANALAMSIYGLWGTWTTDFLVRGFGLTQADANLRFAWIPPVFNTAGGLAGGLMAQRLIRKGSAAIPVRLRIATIASVLAVSTAAAPVAGSPVLAIAAICISLFAVTALSVNYYSIPLDLFGPGQAAFAISILTGIFGLMQFAVSPQIGRWSDTVGWSPVCFGMALLPLASALLLRTAFRTA